MIRNKVKEIIGHLTEAYVDDKECIQIGVCNDTLYVSYKATFDCDDDTVMHVKDANQEIYIAYDKIEYIIG